MTSKEQVCGLCRSRECCFSFGVPLCGSDVLRISRYLVLEPLSFCQAVEVHDEEEGFLLDPQEGRRFRLELSRVGDACIFLMELPGDFCRCQLGPYQPVLCRSFPLALDPMGSLSFYEGAGCCRQWSLADVDIAADIELPLKVEQEMQELSTQVQRWNERIIEERGAASLAELIDFIVGEGL